MSVPRALFLALTCLVLVDCEVRICSQPATRQRDTTRQRYVACSPDGATIALAGGKDGTIHLRDAATGKERAILRGLSGWPPCVTFSPDGGTLASGGWETIQLWDTATNELRGTLRGHRSGVWPLVFSPDGKTLASADCPTICVKLWDVTTGKERHFEAPDWCQEDSDYIQDMAFSPDSRTLAVASYYRIGLWDVDSGKNTAVFGRGSHRPLSLSIWSIINSLLNDYPTEYVRSLSYNPDGKLIACLSSDGEDGNEWMQEVPAVVVNRIGGLCGLAAGLLFLGGCLRLPQDHRTGG